MDQENTANNLSFSPLKAVPLAEIDKYAKEFVDRMRNERKIVSTPGWATMPVDLLKKIAGTMKSKFIIGLIGLKNDYLTISVIPSNEQGNRMIEKDAKKHNIAKTNLADLKLRLKEGLPLKLDKFPLLIKMEADNLIRMANETDCKLILFFLGIEPETNKLTICAAGSDDGKSIHRAHYEKSIMAEETWPEDNFIYFDVNTDHDVLETEI